MAVGVAGEEEGVAGMDMGVVAGRTADIETAKVQEVHRQKVLWSITLLCPDPERGIQNELFRNLQHELHQLVTFKLQLLQHHQTSTASFPSPDSDRKSKSPALVAGSKEFFVQCISSSWKCGYH